MAFEWDMTDGMGWDGMERIDCTTTISHGIEIESVSNSQKDIIVSTIEIRDLNEIANL
jgi:hypothetical protein